MKRVLAIILGGGAGTRLQPLTQTRAKHAVPLGGKYRLIDIPVSNCINSGIHKIYALTQFNSQSLNRHLSLTYNLSTNFREGFVEVLAAQQTPNSPSWFQGTADAVRQYQELFEGWDVDQVLILSGDQLYRMDYAAFVAAHRASGTALTVAAL
ncbi:MAG: glucose-1-phosphate adenylyltransferase, partial [Cyanobacteria bacterium M_surface_9_m1_291]|nr:glucose-1-phosphate adenylyltransferase [Cyanobacteria bacterium M_surface_9_m1_291]